VFQGLSGNKLGFHWETCGPRKIKKYHNRSVWQALLWEMDVKCEQTRQWTTCWRYEARRFKSLDLQDRRARTPLVSDVSSDKGATCPDPEYECLGISKWREHSVERIVCTDIMCVHTYSFIFIYLFIYLLYLFIYLIKLFVYLFIYYLLFIYLCVYSFIYVFIHLFMYLFIYLFVCLCVYLYVYLFICWFICWFICLCIYLFIYLCIYSVQIYIYTYIQDYIYMCICIVSIAIH
jgi:hypothetical protein